jgi:hypothetical protein
MARADGTLRVRATLEPRGPAGAIVLTDDQVAELGIGETPPMGVTINASPPGASRTNGRQEPSRDQRETAFRVERGDRSDRRRRHRTGRGPRTVQVPPALAEAFARDANAKASVAPRSRIATNAVAWSAVHRSLTRRTAACASQRGGAVVPVQHPQGAQRDPSAGLAVAVLHREVDFAPMRVFQ